MNMGNEETNAKINKKGKTSVLLLIIGFSIVTVIAFVVIFLFFSASSSKQNEQINLGDKYLTDLDYDKAILAYKEAIKMDPKDELAYLGLGEVYDALFEKAFEAEDYEKSILYLETGISELENGYKETNSNEIKGKIDDFEEKRKHIEELEEESASEAIDEEIKPLDSSILANIAKKLDDGDEKGALEYFENPEFKELVEQFANSIEISETGSAVQTTKLLFKNTNDRVIGFYADSNWHNPPLFLYYGDMNNNGERFGWGYWIDIEYDVLKKEFEEYDRCVYDCYLTEWTGDMPNGEYTKHHYQYRTSESYISEESGQTINGLLDGPIQYKDYYLKDQNNNPIENTYTHNYINGSADMEFFEETETGYNFKWSDGGINGITGKDWVDQWGGPEGFIENYKYGIFPYGAGS